MRTQVQNVTFHKPTFPVLIGSMLIWITSGSPTIQTFGIATEELIDNGPESVICL